MARARFRVQCERGWTFTNSLNRIHESGDANSRISNTSVVFMQSGLTEKPVFFAQLSRLTLYHRISHPCREIKLFHGLPPQTCPYVPKRRPLPFMVAAHCSHAPESGRRHIGMLLEELYEIRIVIKSQMVGNLLYLHLRTLP